MGLINNIKVLTGNDKPSDNQQSTKLQKKVLIVEDDTSLAKVLSGRLREEGYIVIEAPNGEEGLKMVMVQNPDVILLDLMMPVMSGNAMLHRLREMEPEKKTPVIVLTNAGEVENIRDTMRYHDAIDFLIKSNVSLDTVVAKVKSLAW